MLLSSGYMSGDRVELTSPKSAKHIGAVFINKPQIWVLNNYILSWNTRVQWRQALAVAVRHVWCRLRYREETEQPRRPIAGLPLLEFSPALGSWSDIYTCPTSCLIVTQTFSSFVLYQPSLSFCHPAQLFTERSLLHITRRHAPYCWLAKRLFGTRPRKIAYPAFNVFICDQTLQVSFSELTNFYIFFFIYMLCFRSVFVLCLNHKRVTTDT